MSFSGYDSEAVGFDSVSKLDKRDADNSTQTNEFSCHAVASQTTLPKHSDAQTEQQTPETSGDTADYVGLNAFLKRVVPTMMEALDNNDREFLYNTSDSDEETEAVHANLFQILNNSDISDENDFGGGDQKKPSVLSLSWSSAGNTLAVSLGRTHHDDWCEHDGLIRVYTVKRSAEDKLCHVYNITQNNCVTALQYHPGIAALLAYATSAGEVIVRGLRNASSSGLGDGAYLTSPPGCHGSRKVSALQWADPHLTTNFLTMHLSSTAKRRGASDQVLISAGSDGTINVWQVNANLDIFSLLICYQLYGASPGKQVTPDITCLDFIRLTEPNPKIPDDIFVVGCTTGQLILCNIRKYLPAIESGKFDPTFGSVDPHSSCVLNVAFSSQRPGIFASISTDSELRVYSVGQLSPLKVILKDDALSCMTWVPNNPCLVIVGLGKVENKDQMLMVYNVSSGKNMAVEGLRRDGDNFDAVRSDGPLSATAISINHSCQSRVAMGDSEGNVHVWDIPIRRIKLAGEDYEF